MANKTQYEVYNTWNGNVISRPCSYRVALRISRWAIGLYGDFAIREVVILDEYNAEWLAALAITTTQQGQPPQELTA